MEPLPNLDQFIEKCGTNEIQAFLQLVQDRFLEAQKQKEARLMKTIDNCYDETLDFVKQRRRHLRKQALAALQTLRDRHKLSKDELALHLEQIRSRKRELLDFFREEAAKLTELEQRSAELVAMFTSKRGELAELHRKQLESFKRSALKRLDQARVASFQAVKESPCWDESMDEAVGRLMLLRLSLQIKTPEDADAV
ncbi:hypothetical protein TGPRC2_289590 [Toxoplasma gondii TgCatPRC2]|uniref:Uncharacterized protein n=15 Tax=Toxoplasma gondii TaxID=5811 RepID=B9PTP2_TOXGV|nr:hypothetical protein TGME49_289590 [Toxoplasma gondii ME49]EPR59721.1 hypothetical protein TGGT1_289590 [Toxoplasma gondii GT1]ESS33706.1 hypothetical protein TGVEG_289590 [Toxoplasma gondii VEG]KAF4644439.1 hypothetical protein TGRH88_014330 [Toxoplasma gondii]KFG33318.1 hypothetical protein TGP89_289590 [Toxoplasma gondii p89]KFG42536.1 hypothetical protein TGDOM2_289590 [Toxoplasma gondii GAB2-2007-GAL-DOM2]KFG53341.1 hypothetical protein TGFOU_289590 [Toxoplasma gondii FOU]KFG62709.1 |eukprot:XP_002368384.1 hypothetical protein TGME49_289590 [Toxoplasma gondii ME49]